MPTCERCWNQAFVRSRLLGGLQVDHYHRLLVENEQAHRNPDPSDLAAATPKEDDRG